MKGKYDREAAIALLTCKSTQLLSDGIERYPQRSDFTNEEVIAIKAFLGPWPRALEAAGLKPPRDDKHEQRQQEKRIRSKRRRTAAKIAQRNAKNDGHDENEATKRES